MTNDQTETETETDGEKIPDAPEPIAFTTERGGDVTVAHDDTLGLVTTVETDGLSFTDQRADITTNGGMVILDCGRQRTDDGELVNAAIPLGDNEQSVRDLAQAIEERREAKRDAERRERKAAKERALEKERNRPLELTLREVRDDLKTYDATYKRTRRVLQWNNRETLWGDDCETMAALERVLERTDNGFVVGDDGPFAGVEEDETFAPDEVAAKLGGVEDAKAEIEAERADREQRKQEKREKREAAEKEAAETGEPVTLSTTHTSCNDPEKECNTDIIATVVAPDGDTETRRTHTY